MRIPARDHFWDFVKKTPNCWIWTGYVNQDGYGRIMVPGGPVTTHIFSWKLTNGPIPEGMCVCHKCDNPPCVRPDHLFLGTHLENIKDRDKKDRTAHGVRNYRHKLNPEKVLAMRAMRASGVGYREIGEAFGVNDSAAWKAIKGSNWSRVK
jgi:hypothetical protein